MVVVCARTWSNFSFLRSLLFQLLIRLYFNGENLRDLSDARWTVRDGRTWNEPFFVSLFFVLVKRNHSFLFFSFFFLLLFNWENLKNFCHLMENLFENFISRRVISLFLGLLIGLFFKNYNSNENEVKRQSCTSKFACKCTKNWQSLNFWKLQNLDNSNDKAYRAILWNSLSQSWCWMKIVEKWNVASMHRWSFMS